MFFKEQVIEINHMDIIFRSARAEDAEQLMSYLIATSKETPFLIREPEEITLTLQQEENFLREKEESPRELLLLALENGNHIGSCSISSLGSFSRYAHRCSIAIALYQKYCGQGIGRKMMEAALKAAEEMGYEQAELEVASSNYLAIALYKSLGFTKYGVFPDNMKYKDGSYEDAFWMMKKLRQQP